jgi:HEAT repeats
MKCIDIKELFPDMLTGEIDQDILPTFKEHLKACSSCREELEQLSMFWAKLNVIPEEYPSSHMRVDFYAMLESQIALSKQKQSQRTMLERAKDFFVALLPHQRSIGYAFAVLLLILAFAGGYVVRSISGTNAQELENMQQDIRDMRQLLVISFLEKPSASDRITGASWGSGIANPDEKVLQMMLNILNRDPNANVRLTALESLTHFYNNPEVKQALIKSLETQNSPLVQAALIEMVGKRNETQAIPELEYVVAQPTTHPMVKKYASETIQRMNKTRI